MDSSYVDERLDLVVCAELAVLYFRFIHNVMNTIFHSASFMRRLSEGSASKIVIYAICALSAR